MPQEGETNWPFSDLFEESDRIRAIRPVSPTTPENDLNAEFPTIGISRSKSFVEFETNREIPATGRQLLLVGMFTGRRVFAEGQGFRIYQRAKTQGANVRKHGLVQEEAES